MLASPAHTPSSLGYHMPPEWSPHHGTLMMWPSRARLWGSRFDAVCREYAGVAQAIAAFEPVYMVCNPGDAATVNRLCGDRVQPLEFGADDSWARDCGPIFVTTKAGGIAAVKFGFNAWGNRYHPYDQDALVPDRLAAHFGVPVFSAPLILEGGSFFVDGEGTLITTEQCLLNPNRNPTLGRGQIEDLLRAYLGVTTVIWLPYGHSMDTGPNGTDGHIDGVAQYIAPGHVLLEYPSSEKSSEHGRSRDNEAALLAHPDAGGRELTVHRVDVPLDAEVSMANHYLVNGAVIVPTDGGDGQDAVLAALAEVYPQREIVGVPAATIATGGGGPHCITQQIPAGI